MSYAYLIRNKITNQFYYGSRSIKESPETDLWIKYFTSSKFVKALIDDYGIESFEHQIIFSYDDYDVCYWYEQLLIKETILSPKSLNKYFIDPDTEAKSFYTIGPKSDETKHRMKEAKRRYFSVEGNKEKYRDRFLSLIASGKCRRSFTPDQIREFSNNMASRKQKQQEKRNERINEENSSYREFLSNHMTDINKSRIGVPLSEEHKAKISESCKNIPLSEERRKNISNSLKGKPKSIAAKEALKKAWEKRKAKKLLEQEQVNSHFWPTINTFEAASNQTRLYKWLKHLH